MRPPSISDYIGSLENPEGVFRTLTGVAVERDIYGEVGFRAGNSAAIFTYTDEGRGRRFLKCHIRPNLHLRTIYEYVRRHRPEIVPQMRLLRDELFVHSPTGDAGWMDVVEGEWTEGKTLDVEVAYAAKAGNKTRLCELARAFDSLCEKLLAEEWAHGDLKPENIVVGSDGRMVLIDCDAMWIPELAGQKAAELGTPAYRHPERTASHFSKCIDDYPAMLISASLHALALAPELYARYNTSDNLILMPGEIPGGASEAWNEMLRLFAEAGMVRQFRMTKQLAEEWSEIKSNKNIP